MVGRWTDNMQVVAESYRLKKPGPVPLTPDMYIFVNGYFLMHIYPCLHSGKTFTWPFISPAHGSRRNIHNWMLMQLSCNGVKLDTMTKTAWSIAFLNIWSYASVASEAGEAVSVDLAPQGPDTLAVGQCLTGWMWNASWDEHAPR